MKILSTLFVLLLSLQLWAQEYSDVDLFLVDQFKTYFAASPEDQYDHLNQELQSTVDSVFSIEGSQDEPLDSLAQFISIVQSKDHRIRFISWDEMTGGTWHDMAVFVQFIDQDENIHTTYIDSDIGEDENGIIDDIIYEMHAYKYKGQTYYICFGWGTYGGGHHHKSVNIFTINDQQLQECIECLETKEVFIQASRGDEIVLTYKKGKIMYNNFVRNEETGFMEPSKDITTLERKKNTFKTIQP